MPSVRRNGSVALGGAALAAALALVTPALTHAQTPVPIVPPSTAGEPWAPGDAAKLASDLDALLGGDAALRGAHAGVLVEDTGSGTVLYARNADDEFQPASTLKLLVGSAALDRLGPAYRFHTRLERIAASQAGTSGDALLLRAGGDPFLARRDFEDAANAVAAAGILHAREALVDDSHDDDEPYAPGWTWDDFAYDYAAHVSAMTFEENVAHLTVTPAKTAGALATVRAEPPIQIRSSSGACEGTSAANAMTVTTHVQTGASGSPSTVDVRRASHGCLEVFGSTPAGGEPESVDAAVDDPLAYARGALVQALRTHHVSVDAPDVDEAIRRTGPGGRVVWQHDSAPLEAWLGPRFWIPSDNLVAELLLKELGFVVAGAPGSDESGIAFETAWLQTLGVDPATVTLADGSGLSQYDRITPRALAAILQHDWVGPNRQLVLDSLPVGGARGSIEGIAGTPAAGRVFAKTGSMMHVRGLAGYLATQRHGAVTFAFNVDDWNGAYPALASLRARVLARIVSD